MKKLKYLCVLAALLCSTSSCEKFLNVVPIDALSGNNFWQTQDDAESFANGIYVRLRSKFGNSILIPATEMRGNYVAVKNDLDASGTGPMNNLISNNMRALLSGGGTYADRLREVMNWKGWYDVIQASNILHYEVDNIPANQLSATEKSRYKAEAVFTRNLSYLYLCRLYGDAIYYTEAYSQKSLPRTAQVDVMKNCIADMTAYKNDLPVRVTQSSYTGIRPTRASAVALLMHLNMWAAAWDTNDKKPYYTAVLELAEELASYTDYKVLNKSVENTKLIFKGRSAENLFGILQNFNYGETFSPWSNYSWFFSRYPYRGSMQKVNSHFAYEKEYMEKLYATADSRRTLWFDNYNADNATFQFKKFINTYSTGSGSNVTMFSDDSAIIFRMSDMILLAAEAAAELDDDELAKSYVNQIRDAAGAPSFTSQGNELKNDIYRERCRELIGEGHYYFDLVRTKRIVNSDFTKRVMTVGNFNAGAWTWPLTISSTEQLANPNLIGNTYWN